MTTRTIIVLGVQIDLAEGETYAGLILAEDGSPAHHLVLLPGDNDDATWAEQTAWAESIGGELPSRQEQSLLFANCKQHFESAWYWSGEQHASASSFAWSQGFYDGYQYDSGKSAELRARAVRRSIIQEFSYSKRTYRARRQHIRVTSAVPGPPEVRGLRTNNKGENSMSRLSDKYLAVAVIALGFLAYAIVGANDEQNPAAVEVDTDAVMQVLHSLDRASEVVPVPLLMPANKDHQPKRIQS